MANQVNSSSSSSSSAIIQTPSAIKQQDSLFLHLPLELIMGILQDSTLKIHDLVACSLVCKEMQTIVNNNFLWKKLFKFRFPCSKIQEDANYQKEYECLHKSYANLAAGWCSRRPFCKCVANISALLFHNGKLYQGNEQGIVCIRDLETSTTIGFRYHTDVVTCLIANNEEFFSGSNDGKILKYNLKRSLQPEEYVDHDAEVTSLLNIKEFVVSSDMNGRIVIKAGGITKSFNAGGAVTALVTTSDDKLIAGFQDGAIKIFDISIDELMQTNPTMFNNLYFKEHTALISSLVIADGILISSSLDKKIKLWDMKRGTCIKTLPNQGRITSLKVIDKKLIASNMEREISIYDLETYTYKVIPPNSWIKQDLVAESSITHLCIADSKVFLSFKEQIEVLIFNADDNLILAEIASLFEGDRHNHHETTVPVLQRFSLAPKKIRNTIYNELVALLSENEKQASPEQCWLNAWNWQRAEAIRNYLKKNTS